MQSAKGLLSWQLSLAETLSFGATVAIFTLWAMSTFVAKSDVKEWQSNVDSRVAKIELQIVEMQKSQNQIAVDVSWIRGRLEPKQRDFKSNSVGD